MKKLCAVLTATAVAIALPTPALAQTNSAPKNIIYMVGDGMGYNHVAATNLYQAGEARYQVEGEANPATLKEKPGKAVQQYENFNLLGMSTYQHGNYYDGQKAWSDHNWVNESYTDSAASGTALATGVKTANGKLGVDPNDAKLENASERAKKLGKAAGVVSSVPFSHATPAAWASHNPKRNNYHEIAAEMIAGDLDVIMGAGHPLYTDDAVLAEQANYKYISEKSYEEIMAEGSKWDVIVDESEFQALADGTVKPDQQYFGLAPAASTLQFNRTGNDPLQPFATPENDIVDLPTMSKAALNVLGQDEDGFHLMIEGGAIDWAGHANTIGPNIEEVIDFNEAVDTVIEWVEKNSSWDETLLIVTADHETGYLSGAGDKPGYTALTGAKGEVPSHKYYSPNHTNMLVPIFFKGAGSEDIKAATEGTDPVRGGYVDNTTVAKLTLNKWWAGTGDGSSNAGSSAGTIAGAVAGVIGLIAAIVGALNLPQISDALRNLLPRF